MTRRERFIRSILRQQFELNCFSSVAIEHPRLRSHPRITLNFGGASNGLTDSERVRIDALARYNGEVADGHIHTKSWRELMEREQKWFNEEIAPRQVQNTESRPTE